MKPLSLMLALPPLFTMLTSLTGQVQAQQEFDRTVLPVTEDYAEGDNDFNGEIETVTVELK